ncbi:hypothetical protein TNCV_1937211 [Trichonephila clavipes]|nr:hypothetical protein TNCV_1937211 [Trichonephila clavipes]
MCQLVTWDDHRPMHTPSFSQKAVIGRAGLCDCKSGFHLIKFPFKIKITIWFNESYYRRPTFTPHGPPNYFLAGVDPLEVVVDPWGSIWTTLGNTALDVPALLRLFAFPARHRHALLAKDLVTWQAMVGRHILEDIVGRVAQYVDEHYLVDKWHLGDFIAWVAQSALKYRPRICELSKCLEGPLKMIVCPKKLLPTLSHLVKFLKINAGSDRWPVRLQ